LEAAILNALEDASEPLTESELGKQVEGSTKAKRPALRSLVRGAKVERSGQGRRGDPFAIHVCSFPGEYGNTRTRIQKTAVGPVKYESNSCSRDPRPFAMPERVSEREFATIKEGEL
jgi:hypothetical protein